MDNESLTSEQTEKLLQFQDLIGIDDINVCQDVLTRYDWNLETAIQEQLNIQEGRPSMYASDRREPEVVNDRYLQRVFINQREPERPTNFTGFIGYFVNYMFSFCYSTISAIISTILDLVRSNERIVTDPLGDVTKFIDSYNEKYPNHPVFYQGTYSQALNDAKLQLRFLAVYLHSDSSTEAVSFCRNTLSNPQVIQYINRNMIFWACDISTPEGYRVSHSINARAYPTLVIVVLRANKLIIVGRIEGDCSPTELYERLTTVVSENEVWLARVRDERREREFAQTLRQQQDQAYEESLRVDREKERLRQLEREQKIQRQLEEEAELEAERQRRQDYERLKIETSQRIPPEPEPYENDVTSLLFKFPNGNRIERRFKTTDTLELIHQYIFSHPEAPESFEILTNFPKRVLVTKDTQHFPTISELGLQRRETLFVIDLDA